MTTAIAERTESRARITLGGHGATDALLELFPGSRRAWILRTTGYFVHWIGATLVTGLVTVFDPHVLVLPVAIGGTWFVQAFRRRHRIVRFEGTCPRCASPLGLPPGTWIRLPHRLDCFVCHFEPVLDFR